MKICHLCGSPEENKYCTNESCAEYIGLCDICKKEEDADGRCGCTNKDANP